MICALIAFEFILTHSVGAQRVVVLERLTFSFLSLSSYLLGVVVLF